MWNYEKHVWFILILLHLQIHLREASFRHFTAEKFINRKNPNCENKTMYLLELMKSWIKPILNLFLYIEIFNQLIISFIDLYSTHYHKDGYCGSS